MPASVLIVDDERHTREGLSAALENEYDVYLAANAEEAFNFLDSEELDVVLTDLKMAGKSGLSVIDHTIGLSNPPVTIMMTAYGSVETAVEAMRRGANDFLTKPVNLENLEIVIKRELKSRDLEKENQTLHERLDRKFNLEEIVGNSRPLMEVVEKIKLVAASKATVLLEGETGTGKELFAQAVHQNSERARRPFVVVHCAALPSSLLESELFGHEKGAFTGAAERRIGRFEAAHGGTLFVDEVGEIDASTQVKLLRFLDLRTFERLGSVKPIKVDVRLVVATNQDLNELVKKGAFREDLFYRLNVVPIRLPSLRERKEDIPLLIDHWVRYYVRENGTDDLKIDPTAMRILESYRWPGNIRELRNFAENMVVMRRGGEVSQFDLPPHFVGGVLDVSEAGKTANPLSVEDNEKRLLRNALIESRGNRTKAAKLLGISRRTLHRKLSQWPELDVLEREDE